MGVAHALAAFPGRITGSQLAAVRRWAPAFAGVTF
jgi:hypothetical protein